MSRSVETDIDLSALGIVDDGSTTEVMIYDVKPGRIDDAVVAFQEVFDHYRPEGFSILFSAVDVANNRLIWVHRYAPDFDLTQRFYLGKYPALVHVLWAGSRFDAHAASTEGA
ncbi:hypothetical protein [Microbacterium trichothecenolyticum]|uniref:Uncharacterized protein n=1 Tax=Microbacterium trichothecenolyticum TaxID=69370 RepID=A0A0M2HDR7_MICTR|nr:hypothetical protein [Microbacterium trichothecenolyticum]KJL42327.1 hypothetical protein RS82_02343 [Microbacterium trichothecenolyticum]